ncbi:HRDC domain-containing protein [Paenibacillus sp. JX-17]|uniref:HRDC domain-containing protein n=1 Tax=Paenibacillus lacisoli TaxID=3064525 RepID=A0ABT9CDP2_9BACL|nr:HRDC domain-containing protein [Paenibacillus sp. JX-17]MDO7907382.1 HRDC domain-containing protein [Paenibacillus sp. JX-17]
MQIVFMNCLSRTVSSGRVETAQVWIGEEEGTWSLGWNMEAAEMDDSAQLAEEHWCEGGSWNELLFIYRHKLAEKLTEGYRPLIDGFLHEGLEQRSRNQTVQRLHCYSDLHPHDEVYTELTAWRRRKAASIHKAPYLVASNRLLRLLSVFLPQTVEELLQLPGMGNHKASVYGEELLTITSAVERNHSFPLDWVEERLGEEEYQQWNFRQQEQKYKQDLERFRQREIVLHGMERGLNLDDISSESGVVRRELVEMLEQIEKEGGNTDPLLERELTAVPEQELLAIWSAYDELGDTFLKPVMQRVYGEESHVSGGLDERYERLRLVRIRYRRREEAKADAG